MSLVATITGGKDLPRPTKGFHWYRVENSFTSAIQTIVHSQGINIEATGEEDAKEKIMRLKAALDSLTNG